MTLLSGCQVCRTDHGSRWGVNGEPDQAGFVQVMQGRGSDPERAKQLMAQDADKWAAFRPDVIGSVAIGHDQGLPDLLSISANASGARSARRPMPSRMQWRATHPPRQLTKREFAELGLRRRVTFAGARCGPAQRSCSYAPT